MAMAPLCMQNSKRNTQMQAVKIQCKTNRNNSNPYKIQTFTKWVTSKTPLHTEKIMKKREEVFETKGKVREITNSQTSSCYPTSGAK